MRGENADLVLLFLCVTVSACYGFPWTARQGGKLTGKGELVQIVSHHTEGERLRRSPGMPDDLDLHLVLKGRKVNIRVRRSGKDKPEVTNFPLFVIENGMITRRQLPPLQTAAVYSNDTHGHTLVARRMQDRAEFILEGVFFDGLEQHHVMPDPSGLHWIHTQDRVMDFQGDYIDNTVGKPKEGTTSKKRRRRHINTGVRYTTDEMRYGKIRGTVSKADRISRQLLRERRKRRSVATYEIELFMVADFRDYSQWLGYYDGNKTKTEIEMKLYYAFVANSISQRYHSIANVDPYLQIDILVTGLLIVNSREDSYWTENYVLNPGSLYVEASEALESFKRWIRLVRTNLPDSDHWMLFTGYDIYTDKNPNIAGLAKLGGLCSYLSVSIIEQDNTGSVGATAAHELGHSLSARHDGEMKECHDEDNYIMSRKLKTPDAERVASRPWQFSPCSVRAFREFLSRVKCGQRGTRSGSVLATELGGGQVFSADLQCQLALGPRSYFGRSLQHAESYTSMCRRLYCAVPQHPGVFQAIFAMEKTTCGDGKWCIQGKCTPDSQAPRVRDSCPQGDDPAAPCVKEDCRYYTQRTQEVYCCHTCQQAPHTHNFIFSLAASVPSQLETHTQRVPELPGFEKLTSPTPASSTAVTSSATTEAPVTSASPSSAGSTQSSSTSEWTTLSSPGTAQVSMSSSRTTQSPVTSSGIGTPAAANSLNTTAASTSHASDTATTATSIANHNPGHTTPNRTPTQGPPTTPATQTSRGRMNSGEASSTPGPPPSSLDPSSSKTGATSGAAPEGTIAQGVSTPGSAVLERSTGRPTAQTVTSLRSLTSTELSSTRPPGLSTNSQTVPTLNSHGVRVPKQAPADTEGEVLAAGVKIGDPVISASATPSKAPESAGVGPASAGVEPASTGVGTMPTPTASAVTSGTGSERHSQDPETFAESAKSAAGETTISARPAEAQAMTQATTTVAGASGRSRESSKRHLPDLSVMQNVVQSSGNGLTQDVLPSHPSSNTFQSDVVPSPQDPSSGSNNNNVATVPQTSSTATTPGSNDLALQVQPLSGITAPGSSGNGVASAAAEATSYPPEPAVDTSFPPEPAEVASFPSVATSFPLVLAEVTAFPSDPILAASSPVKPAVEQPPQSQTAISTSPSSNVPAVEAASSPPTSTSQRTTQRPATASSSAITGGSPVTSSATTASESSQKSSGTDIATSRTNTGTLGTDIGTGGGLHLQASTSAAATHPPSTPPVKLATASTSQPPVSAQSSGTSATARPNARTTTAMPEPSATAASTTKTTAAETPAAITEATMSEILLTTSAQTVTSNLGVVSDTTSQTTRTSTTLMTSPSPEETARALAWAAVLRGAPAPSTGTHAPTSGTAAPRDIPTSVQTVQNSGPKPPAGSNGSGTASAATAAEAKSFSSESAAGPSQGQQSEAEPSQGAAAVTVSQSLTTELPLPNAFSGLDPSLDVNLLGGDGSTQISVQGNSNNDNNNRLATGMWQEPRSTTTLPTWNMFLRGSDVSARRPTSNLFHNEPLRRPPTSSVHTTTTGQLTAGGHEQQGPRRCLALCQMFREPTLNSGDTILDGMSRFFRSRLETMFDRIRHVDDYFRLTPSGDRVAPVLGTRDSLAPRILRPLFRPNRQGGG